MNKLEHDVALLNQGKHHDPFSVLGYQKIGKKWQVRVWLPMAEKANIEGLIPLQKMNDFGLFFSNITLKQKKELPKHYRINWLESSGIEASAICPYTFPSVLGEIDLHLFAEGRHWNIYEVMGAHVKEIDHISGVHFSVWAPSAQRVSVVGEFNNWNGLRHPMRCCGGSGVWEIFIPGLESGDIYKFEIVAKNASKCFVKTDPYARAMEVRPETASIVEHSRYKWNDQGWVKKRHAFDWQKKPINIYEVHLGSWQRTDDNKFLNYREIAHRLVEYVEWMGYTHIELLPIMEHPLDQSWGYQVSGYYAPTSRFGSPDDFRYFIDHCHKHDIGVFLDWVPAHFPKDAFALGRFDGGALYEHEDPRKGEHRDWGTYIFNFGKYEVRNFLIANALYWIKEFHIDGLRVDAVASMLYLNYSREDGEWLPNKHGGHENLEAVEFLQTLNAEVHSQHPGAVVMAEESTSWPMVSRPTNTGGLGFSMKWNMGWMNDSLEYLEREPIHRLYHQNDITFSQTYAYTENFILPLSHDEVVHLKHSLLGKMPGDAWQQMANLRLLMGYQLLHPGKKLLFMGCEFAQEKEWNEDQSLDWYLCDQPPNRGVQLMIRDMNHLYASESALYERDFSHDGFRWLDCSDA
ncbi:MAG: 1,4-alpha-glucan branching enzyme, partial [Francisellaceae bacterium]